MPKGGENKVDSHSSAESTVYCFNRSLNYKDRMRSNFEITCHYCDTTIDLTEGGSYPQELFDDGGYFERDCPECGKKLQINTNSAWYYEVDESESDDLNDKNEQP